MADRCKSGIMSIPHAKELLSGQFLAAQGGSLAIERAYCELSQIVKANFELGRVKQLNPASDCGITVRYNVIRQLQLGTVTWFVSSSSAVQR